MISVGNFNDKLSNINYKKDVVNLIDKYVFKMYFGYSDNSNGINLHYLNVFSVTEPKKFDLKRNKLIRYASLNYLNNSSVLMSTISKQSKTTYLNNS